MITNKTLKYLISTWPQRFALAFLTGFLVWIVSGKDLLIFIVSVIASLLVYHLFYLRVKPIKPKQNAEIKF